MEAMEKMIGLGQAQRTRQLEGMLVDGLTESLKESTDHLCAF